MSIRLTTLTPVWVALALLATPAIAADSDAGAGKDGNVAATCLYIPPEFEARVVYYHPFERELDEPLINRIDATFAAAEGTLVDGLAGRGFRVSDRESSKSGAVRLRCPHLTPARPITISMWWRLDREMAPETCFHLATLSGKGIISNFVRGRGQWCALKQPTFVFQVYYFEGVRNHNGVWHGSAWFEPDTWHHVAMTVSSATTVRIYWDGKLRSDHAVKGRPFRKQDGGALELGPTWLFHPMTIDEIMIIDRALTAAEIRDYVTAVQRLAEIAVPVVLTAP